MQEMAEEEERQRKRDERDGTKHPLVNQFCVLAAFYVRQFYLSMRGYVHI